MIEDYFYPKNEPTAAGTVTYCGSNSVSECYWYVLLMSMAMTIAIPAMYGILFLKDEDLSIADVWDTSWVLVLVMMLPAIVAAAFAVNHLIQYLHYSRVELIYVQDVEVKLGSGYRYSSLTFEVSVNGEKKCATTHQIYGHLWSPLEQYVDRIRRVGYDAERDYWVII